MPAHAFSKEQIASLLEARTPRDFFARALTERAKNGQKLSFASIARMAGFASRSFPRDVLLGKKHLSSKSATAISRALKLNADLSCLFLLLVERESEGRSSNTSVVTNERSLETIKRRINRKLLAEELDAELIFINTSSSEIYASLGPRDSGASLAEIIRRSGVGRIEALRALERLRLAGLVKLEQDRYFAISNHLAFEGMKQRGEFQKIYVSRLKSAIRCAETQFDSENNLFLESTFSISSDRLPEFKAELRELLSRFIDGHEASDGDSVASLACALFLPNAEDNSPRPLWRKESPGEEVRK